MADLLLDEERVPAVLDEVGDVGAAQGVEVQAARQAERLAGGGEPVVDRDQADPVGPLGRPQRRAAAGADIRA